MLESSIPPPKQDPIATPPAEVTDLLLAWRTGDQSAFERLAPLVYDELKRLARRYMARERDGHTLQPTALVNEVYLKLVDVSRIQWQNRAHFYAMSARLMRRILVDFARARHSRKRSTGGRQIPFDDELAVVDPAADFVALDEALTSLASVDPRKSQVVELRFFGGLSVVETAEALDVSEDTVTRDWKVAKAWLSRELHAGHREKTRGRRAT
jgi:RNA polymerase sigma factor (TIGR02999 family)